jgi:ubiquinone biosynthesis protein
MVLMRLFQTSRRFNVEIQPQLVLLQKTLLNIEGLGRQLDRTSTSGRPPSPSWNAGCTSRWAGRAPGSGSRSRRRNGRRCCPTAAAGHQFLERRAQNSEGQERCAQLVVEQRRTNRRLSTALLLMGGFLAGIVIVQALAWAGYW